MQQSSKKSGKPVEKPVKGDASIKQKGFDYFENQYHLLEELNSELEIGLYGIKEVKLQIYYLLGKRNELERLFYNPPIPIVGWLRNPANVISNSPSLKEIDSHAKRYLAEYPKLINEFKEDILKRSPESLYEKYPDILPFEMRLMLKAKDNDIDNPAFAAYVFEVCHLYYQKVDSLLEQVHFIENYEEMHEVLIDALSERKRPKASKQSVMIVLNEIKFISKLSDHFGEDAYKKIDSILALLFVSDIDTIRKIREDMHNKHGKNNPYTTKHIIRAAEILKELGYTQEAKSLREKYRV
jgi:hypothetical protein